MEMMWSNLRTATTALLLRRGRGGSGGQGDSSSCEGRCHQQHRQKQQPAGRRICVANVVPLTRLLLLLCCIIVLSGNDVHARTAAHDYGGGTTAIPGSAKSTPTISHETGGYLTEEDSEAYSWDL